MQPPEPPTSAAGRGRERGEERRVRGEGKEKEKKKARATRHGVEEMAPGDGGAAATRGVDSESEECGREKRKKKRSKGEERATLLFTVD